MLNPDHEATRRRVEQYSDISRSAFVVFVVALFLVAAFAAYMAMPS